MNLENIFDKIHKENTWKSSESVSGEGSELKATEKLRQDLKNLLSEYNIKSIFDGPCGDFNWMKEVDLNEIRYIGGDIVSDIIESNNLKYEHEFITIDVTKDNIPEVDLIINRDCLVHFSYDNIFKFISNVKKSGSKYLLTTTFTNKSGNYDIQNGDWRPINLFLPPFNLNKYVSIINEDCREDYPLYKDKSMVLYKIDEL